MNLLCVLLIFSTCSRTYIFYGMCTVTNYIIAIVNGTFVTRMYYYYYYDNPVNPVKITCKIINVSYLGQGLNIASVFCPIPLHVKSNTVVSRYYDTAGIRKKYHYIQAIKISSTNF